MCNCLTTFVIFFSTSLLKNNSPRLATLISAMPAVLDFHKQIQQLFVKMLKATKFYQFHRSTRLLLVTDIKKIKKKKEILTLCILKLLYFA